MFSCKYDPRLDQLQLAMYYLTAKWPIDNYKAVFPNLIWVRGTLTWLCRCLAAPLDGQIGIKMKRLNPLAAPLAPVHGTSVCRGIPVGNHCYKASLLGNFGFDFVTYYKFSSHF